jgi:hypothetical protein
MKKIYVPIAVIIAIAGYVAFAANDLELLSAGRISGSL